VAGERSDVSPPPLAAPSTPPPLRLPHEAECLAKARPSAAAAGGNAPRARLDEGVQRTRRLGAADHVGDSGRRRIRGDDGVRLPAAACSCALALRRHAWSAPRRAPPWPQCSGSSPLGAGVWLSAPAVGAVQASVGARPGRISRPARATELARI